MCSAEAAWPCLPPLRWGGRRVSATPAQGVEQGDLKPLHGSGLLSRLTELRLYDNELAVSDLSGLLGSPSFGQLRTLAIGSPHYGDPAAEAVARAAVLRGLTSLEFRSSNLSG